MNLAVALIQTRTPRSHAAALRHVEPLIREAARAGARLILTPEGVNILERDRSRLLPALETLEADPVARGLSRLAAELGVEILAGSLLLRDGDQRVVNRSVLFGADGSLLAAYDKIHMFDVDLPGAPPIRESAVYAPGAAAVVTPSCAGPLGLTICYDLRFPALFRTLAQAGAELIAAPSAFTRQTGAAHWEVLLRARAIETGSFILAPAQGGVHEDGRETYGRSLVAAPWGEVVGRLEGDEPGILALELDLSAPAAARRAIPSLRNDRVFSLPEQANSPAALNPARPMAAAAGRSSAP